MILLNAGRLGHDTVKAFQQVLAEIEKLKAQNALQEAQIMKLNRRLLDCEKGRRA